MRPYSIKIFLPDGTSDGLRLIEKSNWTGLGIVCPRPVFANAKNRDEFSRAGVYVLTGPADGGSLSRVYIGEAETIRDRLGHHAVNKDFWNLAHFFVSKDANLNKAHVQYLEARLVRLAQEAKRCKLENGNTPRPPSLSEADRADAEGFLEEMLLCFPVIGVQAFEKPESPAHGRIQLQLVGKEATARGYESGEGFVVIAGSRARDQEVASIHGYLSDLRSALKNEGVLEQEGDQLVLSQDYEFTSPSTAAGVFLARTANGRIEWCDEEGSTLKELQERSACSPVLDDA